MQNDVLAKWHVYLADQYPNEVQINVGTTSLEQKIATINWDGGDVGRGRELYRKQQCALCHDGGSRLGPKLDGITKRFSRHDLFRSLLSPSEQVPDRYRALIIETTDGLIVKGTVIYESVDGITLMDATGKTIRVNKFDIESRTKSTKSLMPDGLLDSVDEKGWADLWAFLKTL